MFFAAMQPENLLPRDSIFTGARRRGSFYVPWIVLRHRRR